jgi:hypothetical protein
MQSNRVEDETKIHNEFVLKTYENQMRFAEEQIKLANDEFKLRVQAIITAVDEEREYFNDIIINQESQSKKRKRDIIDEYQAKIYTHHLLLSQNPDQKDLKSLEKDFKKVKDQYADLIDNSEMTIKEDSVINNAKIRLKNLDDHLEEALEEAMALRDETIEEMQGIYNNAKERYEYLKVYLVNKVNPLEPTFFETLERMKKRYEFKLKLAEAELDNKTKDLLDEYLKLYYREQPELDQNALSNYIIEIQNEKDKIVKDYQLEINNIDNEYQKNIDQLNVERDSIIEEAKGIKEGLIKKEEAEIYQKQLELQMLESRYQQQQNDKRAFYEAEVDNLTKEYNLTLTESKKYILDLSQSFEKVLSTYKPYVKLTKTNRRIRLIVKKTDKEIQKKEKIELKRLARKIRRNPLLINK